MSEFIKVMSKITPRLQKCGDLQQFVEAVEYRCGSPRTIYKPLLLPKIFRFISTVAKNNIHVYSRPTEKGKKGVYYFERVRYPKRLDG